MRFGILAGGKGERLIGEGVNIPKPLISLDGIPLILRLIYMFEKSGADDISVFVNDNMPEVISFLQEISPSLEIPLRIVSGVTESSFQSFARLVKFMNPTGKFIITTVDTVFSNSGFTGLVDYFTKLPIGTDGILGVTEFEDDEKPLFVIANKEEDTVTSFSDRRLPSHCYVSAGVYAFTPAVLPLITLAINENVSRMRNFQALLVKEGLKLNIYNMGIVVDVDHQDDIIKARELVLRNGRN